ncbi:YidH family protein [Haematomicrobium sanguinis]|uniref:YidH family protein n=1 Tax=Haematomicrobium sanguinis TaxID=479106 RepID=UPI00047BFD5E|nr:DUF202 domain-containing protein [Haematomicrobium sanguinis]
MASPEDTPRRGRLAGRVLAGGREPDPRFTLANERTFLAWIRTSLALLAGGIAVEAFTVDIFVPEIRKVIAIILLGIAVIIAALASFRWLQVERAMRTNKPLPIPVLAPVVALGACLAAAVVIVFVILR